MDATTPSTDTLAALRRFARARPSLECCELCGEPLAAEHPHLLARDSRQVSCSCDACAILFSGQSEAKFLRVPRRVLRLERFPFDEPTWDALMLPIHLAFLLRAVDGSTTALYPSPAGAMSSLLHLPPWDELVADEPVLLSLEPDVEALLINRTGSQTACYVAPIDACYRLVGLIRTQWRGLSGGPEVRQAIAGFFNELDRKATIVREAPHA